MSFDQIWQTLRERSEALDTDEVLITPASERPFAVAATRPDRIVVSFLDDETDRSLWRDQFEVLHDRLTTESDGTSLADLHAGVEPYVSVLSLAPEYAVDDSAGVLRRSTDTEDAETESPFVRPAWTSRTEPERVHDDALLLADLLERRSPTDPASLSTSDLVDRYVLLSDVQHGADDLRKEVGDTLLEYFGPDDRLHGRFGTVHRTERERRHLKEDDVVLDAIDDAGIPREWVLGVDRDKLDVVLAVTDLDADDVYDVHEQVYVQKTGVEEDEKQSRLQGLKDRLADMDGDDADLRHDIEALEDRIDAALDAQ